MAGQSLFSASLTRKEIRVCPECLSDDLRGAPGLPAARPYGRAIWQVKPIATCFHHNVELVVVSPGRTRPFDFCAHLQALPRGVGGIASTPRRPNAFESYVHSRLRGQSPQGTNWLDAFPLYAVLRMSEMVGGAALVGRRFRHRNGHKTEQATLAGLEALLQGPEGIERVLDGLVGDFSAGRADWGPKSLFGDLYGWLSHEDDDPGYAPLRSVIREFSVTRMPLGPGDRMFGEPFTTRRLHSVRSASLSTGIHPKRLRKVLALKGFIGPTSSGLSDDRVLFDAAAAEPFLRQMSTAMSLAEAARYIDAPRPHERLLLEAGLIRPIATGGTQTLKSHAFAKEDLDRFLFDLLAGTTSGGLERLTMVPINEAARRMGRSTLQVVNLVLFGNLKHLGRRPHEYGYQSVLVDLDEVRSCLDEHSYDYMDLPAAQRVLELPRAELLALNDQDFIKFESLYYPSYSEKTLLVSSGRVTGFRLEYITLRNFAARRRLKTHFTKSALDALGIKPVFYARDVRNTVYARRDLLGILR